MLLTVWQPTVKYANTHDSHKSNVHAQDNV